jgi:hypothetical protein
MSIEKQLWIIETGRIRIQQQQIEDDVPSFYRMF